MTENRFNARAPNTVRRVILGLLIGAYLIMWVGGVSQHWPAGPGPQRDQSWLAALFLTLAGLIVLFSTRDMSERLLLFGAALLGFLAEVVGVHFGFPFGDYSYTGVLGPGLLGVPVVMGFAWMTLAAYVKQAVQHLRLAVWAEVIVGALWMTAFDLLIDPLAANELGYWRWSSTGAYYGVPTINFAGWFIVSVLILTIIRRKFTPCRAARLVGLSLILFFMLVAISFGKFGVALVGACLCTIHIVILGVHRRITTCVSL